jgi:ATP-dependent Clp protease ATP-binding subunit ClpA
VDVLLPRSALDLLDEAASLAQSEPQRVVGDVQVRRALTRWTSAAQAESEVDLQVMTDRLKSAFPAAVADVLLSVFGAPAPEQSSQPRSLLMYTSRGSHRRQFVQALAAALFGSPAALIELDLAEAPWRMVTYPPGRVWLPNDSRLEDALRGGPHAVVTLNRVDRATAAGLELAEHVLRHGQLTDSLGRRLDLKQAAIVVTGQRNSLLDPGLLGLVSGTLGLE